MADDDNSNGHSTAPPGLLVSSHEEDLRSLERMVRLLTSELRTGLESLNDKIARSSARDERIENLLVDLHARFDRALNAVDGLDVRKRLAVVEEALNEKPRRSRAGRK